MNFLVWFILYLYIEVFYFIIIKMLFVINLGIKNIIFYIVFKFFIRVKKEFDWLENV